MKKIHDEMDYLNNEESPFFLASLAFLPAFLSEGEEPGESPLEGRASGDMPVNDRSSEA